MSPLLRLLAAAYLPAHWISYLTWLQLTRAMERPEAPFGPLSFVALLIIGLLFAAPSSLLLVRVGATSLDRWSGCTAITVIGFASLPFVVGRPELFASVWTAVITAGIVLLRSLESSQKNWPMYMRGLFVGVVAIALIALLAFAVGTSLSYLQSLKVGPLLPENLRALQRTQQLQDMMGIGYHGIGLIILFLMHLNISSLQKAYLSSSLLQRCVNLQGSSNDLALLVSSERWYDLARSLLSQAAESEVSGRAKRSSLLEAFDLLRRLGEMPIRSDWELVALTLEGTAQLDLEQIRSFAACRHGEIPDRTRLIALMLCGARARPQSQ